MTRQEVKDEARQYSLAPEVRSAIRRRQMQAARARMMAAVPKADVVVTNPTHFAVALRYDGEPGGTRGRRQGPGPRRRCRSAGSRRRTTSRSCLTRRSPARCTATVAVGR